MVYGPVRRKIMLTFKLMSKMELFTRCVQLSGVLLAISSNFEKMAISLCFAHAGNCAQYLTSVVEM